MRMIIMDTLNTTEVANLFAKYLDARWDFDYNARKKDECGLDSYMYSLYSTDADKAWDRMWDTEQALEALGIDIRSAIYRREKTEEDAA